MANRANPPKIQNIAPCLVPETRTYTLANGAKMHVLDEALDQAVLRLELIIPASRLQETKALIARATAKLLKMGTQQHTADQLSEILDFYGTKLKISDGFDSTTVRMYCLHRNLPAMLDIIMEVLTTPVFAAEELEKFVRRSKEHLRVDLQKADFLAYRKFTELVFGAQHPYGYNSYAELYDAIAVADLHQFYQNYYQNEAPTVVLVGQINSEIEKLIADKLATLPTNGPLAKNIIQPFAPLPNIDRVVAHESIAENQQAAIRIGRRLFNKHHEDFPAFFVLNTVLGGYFGARLMQNLREDKGYTYGVYSSVDDMNFGGYFGIDTEVGLEVADDAIEQIYIEMDKLCQDKIPAKELDMVKNYLMGTYVNAFDGFFNRANTFSDAIHADLPLSFIADLAKTTQDITAEQLRELAQKYFAKDQLLEVVVK